MNASYDLLTNRQRKEYHVKAILYLENESRRCESCGNTYFGNLAFNESQLLDDCEIKITSDSLFEYGAVERVRLSVRSKHRLILYLSYIIYYVFSNCSYFLTIHLVLPL